MKPQIGISHIEIIPAGIIDEFVAGVSSDHFDVQVRTHGSVFAGIEWLMPTAIVLFITRAYFDAIFSELGKDHYKALTRGMKALYRHASALKLTRRSDTPSKVSTHQPYSLGFSVVVALGDGLTFKFLIQPKLSEADAECALNAFFDFVESICDGSVGDEVIERLGEGPVVGRTLLLAFDFEQSAIVAVDPMKRPSPI